MVLSSNASNFQKVWNMAQYNNQLGRPMATNPQKPMMMSSNVQSPSVQQIGAKQRQVGQHALTHFRSA